MDWLGTWGVAMGAAWLSGVKLYASVLTLGLLQHFGFASLPGELRVLGEWWVIAIAGLLFLFDFGTLSQRPDAQQNMRIRIHAERTRWSQVGPREPVSVLSSAASPCFWRATPDIVRSTAAA